MTRDKFPGWSVIEDGYLQETEPVPEPEPAPRRTGCSVFALLLALILAASIIPDPRVAAAEPEPTGAIGTVLLGGKATWYDTPGHTAAAGPVLRDVLGDWRGRFVTVEAGDRSVTVQLTDWCACGERGGIPTLLDLSRSAFAALADPSAGVVSVSIEIDGSPRPDPRDDAMRDEVRDPLPATDVAP